MIEPLLEAIHASNVGYRLKHLLTVFFIFIFILFYFYLFIYFCEQASKHIESILTSFNMVLADQACMV